MSQAQNDSTPRDCDTVDRIIRARRTSKLLQSADKLNELMAQSGNLASGWNAQHSAELRSMLGVAAWAPFHRRAHEVTHRQGELDSVVPWRFHVLENEACYKLLHFLHQQAEQSPDSQWSRAWQSKITNMLAACGALVQVSWLPDPTDEGAAPEFSENNIEHVAATGAAIQNLLLAAEARGWRSYWSSGGILREAEVFDFLGMGRNEALLGSVFLSPAVADGVNVKDGGLRDQRGEMDGWARWVPSE